MVFVVFGIQGVGKSAVVKEVINRDTKVVRLYWGEHTLRLAKEKFGIDDIDTIRNMNVMKQKELQMYVAKELTKIIEQDTKADYIIETHAALKTRQGFFPGFTPEILKMLNPALFIVIETDPRDIYHRRQLDETRKRDHDKTVREIELNLDTTRWYASSFATMSGANLYILNNIQDNIDHAVDKVLELFAVYREA